MYWSKLVASTIPWNYFGTITRSSMYI